MAIATVLPIRPATKASPRKRRVTRAAIIRRHAPAAGLGAVILVLIGLSLSHLAHGVSIVTGCADWEAYAMAIGLDLLIVGLEVAMVVTAGTKAHKPVARFANPALIAAFTWSAGLNYRFHSCLNRGIFGVFLGRVRARDMIRFGYLIRGGGWSSAPRSKSGN
jgi:hypothetical protein